VEWAGLAPGAALAAGHPGYPGLLLRDAAPAPASRVEAAGQPREAGCGGGRCQKDGEQLGFFLQGFAVFARSSRRGASA